MRYLSGMTLPNALSTFRCLAVLAIAVLLALEEARVWTLGLFVAAAVTDWLDGWIARKFNMMSEVGRVLDIIADKLLVGVVLLMLAADGTIPAIHAVAAALILAREIGISGLREHLATKNVSIPASLAGKWKTTVQLVSLAVLIAAPILPWPSVGAIAGLVLLWIAAALTVWSGWQYVWGSRGAWGDG